MHLNFGATFEELKQKLSPYTKRAYLVGGGVRDMILGKSPKDLDIEIYDILPDNFALLARQWGAIGVGKSFYVYKWKGLDLSLPRIENKIAPTHQGFEVGFCNDEKIASSRRDFTMNALMINIFTCRLYDFWGGKEDIEQKTIRLLDKDKFIEDSLRVLRGARFASQLGFIIEKNTFKLMQSMNLNELSKERIFWELENIFLSSYPEIGFLNLYKLGVLMSIFGVNMKFEKAFDIAKKIRLFSTYKSEFLSQFIFLYIFLNELNLDIKKSLEAINAPKIYFKILLNSPYKLLPIKDEELLHVSLDLPLKHWVGVCQDGLIKKAKKLGIYDDIFSGGVDVQDVIKDGFSGKDIGVELKRRKIKAIHVKAKNE